jgi:hypothetical protein
MMPGSALIEAIYKLPGNRAQLKIGEARDEKGEFL